MMTRHSNPSSVGRGTFLTAYGVPYLVQLREAEKHAICAVCATIEQHRTNERHSTRSPAIDRKVDAPHRARAEQRALLQLFHPHLVTVRMRVTGEGQAASEGYGLKGEALALNVALT